MIPLSLSTPTSRLLGSTSSRPDPRIASKSSDTERSSESLTTRVPPPPPRTSRKRPLFTPQATAALKSSSPSPLRTLASSSGSSPVARRSPNTTSSGSLSILRPRAVSSATWRVTDRLSTSPYPASVSTAEATVERSTPSAAATSSRDCGRPGCFERYSRTLTSTSLSCITKSNPS